MSAGGSLDKVMMATLPDRGGAGDVSAAKPRISLARVGLGGASCALPQTPGPQFVMRIAKGRRFVPRSEDLGKNRCRVTVHTDLSNKKASAPSTKRSLPLGRRLLSTTMTAAPVTPAGL